MALIKCKECGKQISDTANVCMGCGAPVGGGGSVVNIAFEKRIEQYKANGYKQIKRDGNTVRMGKTKNLIAVIVTLLWVGLAFLLFLVHYESGLLMLQTIIGVFAIIIIASVKGVATISITKTGKIEEVGNVLKNK